MSGLTEFALHRRAFLGMYAGGLINLPAAAIAMPGAPTQCGTRAFRRRPLVLMEIT